VRVLIGAAVLAVGLMAGFYYAYACSVMLGLAQTDDRTFVTAMQAINASVRNAAFAPAFFGSLLLSLILAVVGVARRRPGAGWVVAAAGLYVASFLVTMTLNVPLNEALAAAGPADQIGDLAAVRDAFEQPWVTWNLVRTLLASASLLTLGLALARRA
jgi:uncharacterized membrane protein